MPDLRVNLCGMDLVSPIVVASGTFGFGREYASFYPLEKLGGVCAKGLTLHPRTGNPSPRIAETPAGILNSVGLQNPGVKGFVSDELPWLREQGTKVIANLSAGTVEEFAEMAELLSVPGVDMLEVNISCPNVKCEGLAFGTQTSTAAAATKAVKSRTHLPVLVKLSPNVTSIADIARAVADAGADGISLINTLLGMRIDLNTRRPILKNNTGGLSGPAVLPVAVRCIQQVHQAVDLPLLGMGGVTSGEDAAELMMAGATAVAVGTATLTDPMAPIRITQELEDFCQRQGVDRVRDLTGTLRLW
jgi:dihydroorotate dehydrogenase (NAD+) catalytic subunit